MMPYKRPAADKSGVPVYQPNATTYQQLMQLQQPFVPVSCEYSSPPTSSTATTSVSPPSVVTAEPQLVPVTATSQLPSQITAAATANKEQNSAGDVVTTSRPASTPAAAAAAVPTALPPTAIPDPAAIAKEVAQQNYAKAVKLAAANQSLAAVNSLNPLNPLNYTGVALNKQTMSIPPPTFARYPTAAALPLGLGTTGLGFGIGNPYAAQSNFLNVAAAAAAARPVLNPYNPLVRASYTTAATPHIFSPGLLTAAAAAQYPVSVATTPITSVPSATSIAAAAVQSNNNNNNLQPYKKLKTT